jgi:Mrp family chromosome partitioning ATPase
MNVPIRPSPLPPPGFMPASEGALLLHALTRQGEGGAVIQLIAARGGQGTSSLCRDLALIGAGGSGRRVLLLDLESSASGHMEAARAWHPLMDVEPDADLAVVRCGSSSLHVGALRDPSHGWPCVIPRLRARFELVIVDAPSIDRSPAGVILAPLADATVLVVTAGSTRASEIRHLRDRLFDAGGRIAGTVLNRGGLPGRR